MLEPQTQELKTAKSMSEYRRLKAQGVQILPPTVTVEVDEFKLGAACDPSKMEECESCQ